MWYYYSYYFKIFLLVSKGNKSTNFSIGPILKSNSSSVFCINAFISKWKSLLSQWEEKESQAFGSLFTELKNLLSLKQCFTHVTNWMYTQNSLTVRCLWFSWGVVAHVKGILNCARSSNGSCGLHECGLGPSLAVLGLFSGNDDWPEKPPKSFSSECLWG